MAEPSSPRSPSPKSKKPPVLPPRSYSDASSPTPPNVPPPVSIKLDNYKLNETMAIYSQAWSNFTCR